MRNLPAINDKYWLALMAASVFGTNTGDYVARYLHLGHLAGLPILALIFAVILVVERATRPRTAVYFWAAIITIRTAATNVGDAFHDFGLGFGISIPVVLALFALTVFIYRRAAPDTNARTGTVRVNPVYWTCMMLAGVLGTLIGDFAAGPLRLTALGATAVFVVLIVAAVRYFGRRSILLNALPYWFTVALIRIGGTDGGDAVAHGIGLALSTAVTGLAFVGLVAWFYRIEATNQVAAYPGR